MYAVISTGGKQYRVSEGSVLRVEKLEAEAGANVEFDKVLLVGQGDSVKIGSPFLSGGKVVATVQSHGKGDKVRSSNSAVASTTCARARTASPTRK